MTPVSTRTAASAWAGVPLNHGQHAGRGTRARMFVIHQHDATRMHWISGSRSTACCARGRSPRSRRWTRGQAPRGQGREPPARVRPLRGGDPGRQLRRRSDDRWDAASSGTGRSGAGPDRRRDQVRALRLQAARRVHAGPHRQGKRGRSSGRGSNDWLLHEEADEPAEHSSPPVTAVGRERAVGLAIDELAAARRTTARSSRSSNRSVRRAARSRCPRSS